MSGSDLRKWMDANGFRVVDVASTLGFDPNTVRKFLKDKPVNPSTKKALERLVATYQPQKKAVG